MKHLTLVILLALAPSSLGDEPLMTTPFRCFVDEIGGVNHAKDSKFAGLFNIRGEEFRLMPRNNMPSAILEHWDKFGVNQANINKIGDGVWEKFTYFFRAAADDPQLVLSWQGCYLTSEVIVDNRIVCGTSPFLNSLFRVNLDTKRFVYTDLGTWDSPNNREGYYGDSSLLMFGQCRPYYD